MHIFKKNRREERPKLRMTPMIDIVFLLIIFFMCVAELSKREIEAVTLPEAMSAVPQKGDPRLTVNVMRDGTYRVARKTYSPRALGKLITRRAVEVPGPDGLSTLAVRIRADAGVPYKHVQRVVGDCSSARVWIISFAATPGRER